MTRILLVIALGACGGGHTGVDANLDGACAGLDLHDCRLAPGCVADECEGCGCGTTYRGCLAAGVTPEMCPALGCPSGICCSADRTCEGSTGTCTTPGTTLGCGACNTMTGDCTTDTECKARGATLVCDPIACSCNSESACVTGCVDDTTCDEGHHCDLAAARCVARACSAAAPCPGNFDCASGSCARRTCTADLDCDGYCVNHRCFTQQGECQQPVP